MRIKTLNESVGQEIEWPNVKSYKLNQRGWGAVYIYTGLNGEVKAHVTFEYRKPDVISVEIVFEGGGYRGGGMVFSSGKIDGITDFDAVPEAVSSLLGAFDTECIRPLFQKLFDLSLGDVLSVMNGDTFFESSINKAVAKANTLILRNGKLIGDPEITYCFRA